MPILELRAISKRFSGVIALDGVNFQIDRGEVVALIGENGAGKSTLMKILGGIHQPDGGTIHIEGRQVHIRSTAEAQRLGIGFVHQELNNLGNLDVGANLFLGREPRWGGPLQLVDGRRIIREARPYLTRLGLDLDPCTPVAQLSLAEQQMVEVARALVQKSQILILDEPTSSLTLAETEWLLDSVRELREQGVSVVYISHRLGEIHRIADRVVALRDGRNVGDLAREQINHNAMVRLMIGRDINSFYVHCNGRRNDVRLRVRGVRTRAHRRHAISLDVRAGEILGLAGLAGAGRSELAQTLFGIDPPVDGEVWVDGKRLSMRSPRRAINAGLYLVPEDRRRTGLLMGMTIRENMTLAALWRYSVAALIVRSREHKVANRFTETLRIKTPSIETPVRSLSGGNQQKVVLAKWLSLEPAVLIVDEPTRGIDVGAKAEIYRLLRDLAARGVAVIVISSDMEEVLGISDRIAVMHEGALAGVLERSDCSEEAVMQLAVGKKLGATELTAPSGA